MDSAKRTVGMIGQVMAKAVVLGLARSNPTVGLAAAPRGRAASAEPRRDITIPTPSAFSCARFGNTLTESVAKELLKTILLTFARPGEVGGMRWDQIDMAAEGSDLHGLEGRAAGPYRAPVSAGACDYRWHAPAHRQAPVCLRQPNYRPAALRPDPDRDDFPPRCRSECHDGSRCSRHREDAPYRTSRISRSAGRDAAISCPEGHSRHRLQPHPVASRTARDDAGLR